MIREWEIRTRETVLDLGLFQVEKKRVVSPRTQEERDALGILFPDWAMVLPLTSRDRVVMVSQYRHGNEAVCLELPGGLVDPQDKEPMEAARRELREETGYDGGEFVPLGACFPQPAILRNRCHFFLARDVFLGDAQALDAGEDIEVQEIPMEKIPAMIQCGQITNGMVLLAFGLYGMQSTG